MGINCRGTNNYSDLHTMFCQIDTPFPLYQTIFCRICRHTGLTDCAWNYIAHTQNIKRGSELYQVCLTTYYKHAISCGYSPYGSSLVKITWQSGAHSNRYTRSISIHPIWYPRDNRTMVRMIYAPHKQHPFLKKYPLAWTTFYVMLLP